MKSLVSKIKDETKRPKPPRIMCTPHRMSSEAIRRSICELPTEVHETIGVHAEDITPIPNEYSICRLAARSQSRIADSTNFFFSPTNFPFFANFVSFFAKWGLFFATF